MTDFSSNSDGQALEAGPDGTCKHYSNRSSRRKRSLYSKIRHHLYKMLRTVTIYRAGFVLLPLAGFIYVSFVNDVLSPRDRIDPVMRESSLIRNDSPTGPAAGKLKHTRFASGLSGNGPVFLPVGVGGALFTHTNAELVTSNTSAATSRSFKRTSTYVVNEGGSLWRTGRRFIANEVLLDQLIDNLSENGMNVRNVSAGVEFIVNDLGSKGLLVVVVDGVDTYESRIVESNVTSSFHRQTAIEVDSSRTASLDQ